MSNLFSQMGLNSHALFSVVEECSSTAIGVSVAGGVVVGFISGIYSQDSHCNHKEESF